VVDRVVAVVNHEPIMWSDLQEAILLSARDRPGGAPVSPEVQRQVLDRLVTLRLQVQEARRERIQVTDEEIQAQVDEFVKRNGGDRAEVESRLRAQGLTWELMRRELREHLLARKIQARRVGRRASVTEAEVDAYVAQNRQKLEAGLKYHARTLAVLARPPDQSRAWDEARKAIESIQAELRAGGDFAELAKARSQDPSAGSGGDLGWLPRGELQPLFEEAILKLATGQVSEPIRSSVGYHLFRLDDREELTEEALARFRQQGRDLIIQQRAQERFEEWARELRRGALIDMRL
jgi:peptidyl-prolyl cis-trans isomerase SurA